jgi:hypothetical protein
LVKIKRAVSNFGGISLMLIGKNANLKELFFKKFQFFSIKMGNFAMF